MRAHLENVERNLLRPRPSADAVGDLRGAAQVSAVRA
jgi:hypothetical protein